ncbi:MAG: rRNA pseudouridine synthase, partial [Paramuribaculum sp.]
GYQPRYNQGGYQPRYNNNQGGYKPRYNQGGYQPRPYQPRPDHDAPVTDSASKGADDTQTEGAAAGAETRQNSYQPRYNNNNHGGYQPRYNQGGYQPRYNNNNQGGYQPRYNNNNNNNNQGGYQPRYNNNQGGYKPRYNNPDGQQGGYKPRFNNNNNQGGYKPRYGNNQGGPGRQQRPATNQYGMPKGGKSFTPRPKPVEYEQPIPDPNEQIRLNKYMANAGICSRREADEFITQGLVKVNGQVVTELGTKITCTDVVEYDEKVVTLERKTYILLNKPKDCVTTSDDPNGRTTVLDLVKGACDERIYPVGRLDRNTTGVLLLTNDGDLASKLTHPKFVKKKIYHVWTDKDISEDDMQAIADGIELEDGPIHADAISYATETDRNQAGIEIHSGRNRIVRRIFEKLGYRVTKLDRVYFAGLTKKNLPRGRWRYLTQEEVNFLKMGSFE